MTEKPEEVLQNPQRWYGDDDYLTLISLESQRLPRPVQPQVSALGQWRLVEVVAVRPHFIPGEGFLCRKVSCVVYINSSQLKLHDWLSHAFYKSYTIQICARF